MSTKPWLTEMPADEPEGEDFEGEDFAAMLQVEVETARRELVRRADRVAALVELLAIARELEGATGTRVTAEQVLAEPDTLGDPMTPDDELALAARRALIRRVLIEEEEA